MSIWLHEKAKRTLKIAVFVHLKYTERCCLFLISLVKMREQTLKYLGSVTSELSQL